MYVDRSLCAFNDDRIEALVSKNVMVIIDHQTNVTNRVERLTWRRVDLRGGKDGGFGACSSDSRYLILLPGSVYSAHRSSSVRKHTYGNTSVRQLSGLSI